ncbi:Methyl-CpG DNA binding [Macleaya cordata]|uniref:Methyl-CpG DNA binding n=1 Tax=Macleaya cordata TaxID=56857 RepID=A0A200QUK5_MACCD|nr:Methyl-CpG DNA binding [Macleaya cordata]
MDGSPDCLPKGWTVEIKSRKSGPRTGDKYKCYVAPTGLRFYSKRQVSDYLKIKNLRNTSRLNKRSVDMPTTSQATVEWKSDTDEGLPPGWTKTIKCKKTGDKTRKDPYYTDPVTGYIFRSRRDVFRYIETGEIGRHAIKPKNAGVNDLEVDEKNSPPTAAKRQKLEASTTKRCLFTGQSSNLSETVTDEKILEPSATKEIIPVLKHASVQSGESAGLSILASPESDDSKKMAGRELRSSDRLVTALPAPVASSEKQKQQLKEGEAKSGNRKTELKSSKSKDKKELSVPRRASKRLAGIKADPVPDLEIGRRKSQVGTALEANPVMVEKTSNSSHQVPEQVDQLGSALESKSTVGTNEDGKVPSKCGNSLHEGGNTLVTKEQPKECEAASGNLGNTLVTKEQLKKCEAASGNVGATEKANEKPESPLISPFGDSWPDPCLEFAFKTLTGDNLVIEDYFQQQLGSVQTQNTSDLTLPDCSVDGFCQASDLFQFDALERPPPPPQLQKNPVLSAPGNANMISFEGNDVLQQPSQNGTNSQDR